MTNKPILCLDFDGVIHSQTSGWVEADFIPDPPVEGAIDFLYDALDHFDIKIYSSRSTHDQNIRAMMTWLRYWTDKYFRSQELSNLIAAYGTSDWKLCANKIINEICNNKEAWPKEKPPSFLTIDDRALTFNGDWNEFNIQELLKFKPWNKK